MEFTGTFDGFILPILPILVRQAKPDRPCRVKGSTM
jgi:hypothetical protein